MQIDVHRSIDEIDAGAWDEIVAADSLIRRHAFLRAVERSRINDCQYWYLVARDENRIAAHCSAFSISLFLDIFGGGAVARFATAVRRFWPAFLRLRELECGSPVALGHLFSVRDGVAYDDVVPRFVPVLEAISRQERIPLLVARDFVAEELPAFQGFPRARWGPAPNLPDVMLANRWPSFEAYLQDMRSDYRYKIRKRSRKAEAAGIRCEVRGSFSDLAERLCALWTETFRRSREYQREILTEDYFREMDANLGERSRVVLLLKGDEVVAFALVLVDDLTLRFVYTGLDYRYNRDDCLYFKLLYEVVRFGIESGKPYIELGITTYPPKFDLGGRIRPLHMWMKHTSRVLSPLVVATFRATTPQQATAGRNVFRPEPS